MFGVYIIAGQSHLSSGPVNDFIQVLFSHTPGLRKMILPNAGQNNKQIHNVSTYTQHTHTCNGRPWVLRPEGCRP